MQTPDAPALQLEHVNRVFDVRTPGLMKRRVGLIRAVDDVSLRLEQGKTIALVGETGCGKTTLARCVVRLTAVSSGSIHLLGRDITRARGRALRDVRRQVQLVFQDPYSSLNPRRTVESILSTPLRVQRNLSRAETKRSARELMELVGLEPGHLKRYPHEFSGGQRQRIGIARALAPEPKLLICDEPASSLDVSVQSQVLNLLTDLQRKLGLSYLLISHDLAVVRQMADEIAVMYLGRVVEWADNESLFTDPRHPYTQALLLAIPVPEPGHPPSRAGVRGEPPAAIDLPSGCRFHPRCPRATDLCGKNSPELLDVTPGHDAACHYRLDTSPAREERLETR